MENEITPHKEAKLKSEAECRQCTYHDDAATLGCQYKAERGEYHREDATVAGEMQKTIQVYIIEYTHDEKDYSVGKQLPGQCNINGVVTHSQPLTGSAVFDFYTDRINGDHEDEQHEYSRYQCIAEVYRIVSKPTDLFSGCVSITIGCRKPIA